MFRAKGLLSKMCSRRVFFYSPVLNWAAGMWRERSVGWAERGLITSGGVWWKYQEVSSGDSTRRHMLCHTSLHFCLAHVDLLLLSMYVKFKKKIANKLVICRLYLLCIFNEFIVFTKRHATHTGHWIVWLWVVLIKLYRPLHLSI